MDRSEFPFPLNGDTFAYSNNLRPLEPPVVIDVTTAYEDEVRLKRGLLQRDAERCFLAEPESADGQWEVLDYVLHELSTVHPNLFQLEKNGNVWTFTNCVLRESTVFTFYNAATLPFAPLDFAGRQVQEDLLLLGQYDDRLMLEAGQLCFPGNWSLHFDMGMPFQRIHAPVPGLLSDGLAKQIERFLMHLETGKPWTRLNWSLNAGRRLDTSPETFDEWGPTRYQVTRDNVASLVHLRVEVQNLVRMPRTNGLLFTIHTHLLALHEVAQNPLWLSRLYHVLESLSPDLTDYKGLSAYRDVVVEYLHEKLAVQS
ncbi:heme-dependent oxidative N-demethylase family protein [Alicyclobacillus sp. ALC3]|uniref:heme-dependent oxidative N-demethylase family protein n=1 Tax=Alicyclobacillus sp. ALC3 TaxID=2796143 RepID=UPI0023791BDF|nr:DUF3445 domain-containing protein [Alicyclobacillus sp. ALC3]WDL96127.1 DUF3445 domain-containing protein [Alicyclobacillus sp. ALC3]